LKVIHVWPEEEAGVLGSRDAVRAVLIEAGADLLLRRISPARAEAIEEEVDAISACSIAWPPSRRRWPSCSGASTASKR